MMQFTLWCSVVLLLLCTASCSMIDADLPASVYEAVNESVIPSSAYYPHSLPSRGHVVEPTFDDMACCG